MNGRFERKWSSAEIEASLIAIAQSDLQKPYKAALVPPLVPYLTLFTRAQSDRGLKRLLEAAVEIRKERKEQERTARKRRAAREIVARVRDGATIKQACGGSMSFSALHAYLSESVAARTALQDASRERRRSVDSERWRRYTAEQIAEVADLIRGGSSIKDAFAAVAPGVNGNSHNSFFKREPKLKKIIDDAVAYRESTDLATGRAVYVKKTYTESDWSAALSAIAFANGRSLRSLLVAPLIPYQTIFMRTQRDEMFAARYRSAIAEYRTGRRRKRAKRMKVAAAPRAKEALRSGLLMDDLYREVSALFAPEHPDRDDMISEVVVAVLEGDLSREDIPRLGPKIGRACANRLNDKRMDALDRPIGFDGSGALLIDTITADQWSFEGA